MRRRTGREVVSERIDGRQPSDEHCNPRPDCKVQYELGK
jgi:hypothetical protein